MTDRWPYIVDLNTFQSYPLEIGGSTYGSVDLYTGPVIQLPGTVPCPTQGGSYPPDPGSHSSFLEMFKWLANHVGQTLYEMNETLMDLHKRTMGGHQPDNGQLNQYAANAKKILGTLRLPDSAIWPLIPANKSHRVYQDYVFPVGSKKSCSTAVVEFEQPA